MYLCGHHSELTNIACARLHATCTHYHNRVVPRPSEIIRKGYRHGITATAEIALIIAWYAVVTGPLGKCIEVRACAMPCPMHHVYCAEGGQQKHRLGTGWHTCFALSISIT